MLIQSVSNKEAATFAAGAPAGETHAQARIISFYREARHIRIVFQLLKQPDQGSADPVKSAVFAIVRPAIISWPKHRTDEPTRNHRPDCREKALTRPWRPLIFLSDVI